MGYIKWQESMEIGVESIDDQHKKLVSMINQLELSLIEGKGIVNADVRDVIVKLVDYTQYHFVDEEQFMSKIEFSELNNHIHLHKLLVERVKQFLMTLKEGGSVNVFDLMSFLADWLITHIMAEDMKIGNEYKKTVLHASE